MFVIFGAVFAVLSFEQRNPQQTTSNYATMQRALADKGRMSARSQTSEPEQAVEITSASVLGGCAAMQTDLAVIRKRLQNVLRDSRTRLRRCAAVVLRPHFFA
jgi:hypothetical protein